VPVALIEQKSASMRGDQHDSEIVEGDDWALLIKQGERFGGRRNGGQELLGQHDLIGEGENDTSGDQVSDDMDRVDSARARDEAGAKGPLEGDALDVAAFVCEQLERPQLLIHIYQRDLTHDAILERRAKQAVEDACAPAIVPDRHGIVFADTEQDSIWRMSQALV